jgi:hypothetical protein
MLLLSQLFFLLSQARWMESLTIVANSQGASGRGCFQASFFIYHILAFTLTGIVLQTHYKKVSDFPVPNRDVTAQTLPGEKSLTLFYSAVWKQPVSRLPRHCIKKVVVFPVPSRDVTNQSLPATVEVSDDSDKTSIISWPTFNWSLSRAFPWTISHKRKL